MSLSQSHFKLRLLLLTKLFIIEQILFVPSLKLKEYKVKLSVSAAMYFALRSQKYAI